jgi:hypothetical protein
VGPAAAWNYGRIPHLTLTLSAPKGGEGDSEFSGDSLQHTPNVFHHIPIPEPGYPIAAARDLDGSILILTAKRVLPAVELDCQFHRRAGEIHDVPADRVLR